MTDGGRFSIERRKSVCAEEYGIVDRNNPVAS